MRTNIEIDDRLMAAALQATGVHTKREAVELGLKALVRMQQQASLKMLQGQLEWIGDLDASRLDD